MNGHALLIGCEVGELSGIDNDLDVMEKALRSRGLAVRRISGPQATRDAILAAYRRLIDTVRPEECAVVYYSGHGGRVEAPPPDTPGPSPMDLQFIVPTDFHDCAPGDFRGITSVELSALLARLTDRTANVTVILDCCHSAHISRGPALWVKALSKREQYEVLRGHVERLRARGELPAGPLAPLGNRGAVRVVACAPEQSAFEYQGVDGRRIGILTESLALALAEAGAERVSWATVMDRVRRRVTSLFPFQRPEVEGPSLRMLFETEQDDANPLATVVALDRGRARIPCGALLGVQIGDVFEIELPGAVGATAPVLVGTLCIDRLDAYSAEGSVMFAPGHSVVPPSARARQTTAVAPAMPVLLPDPADPRCAALLAAIAAAPGLRPAGPGEPWPTEVRIGANDSLTIHDRIGPLPNTYTADVIGATAARRALEALARVQALRAMVGLSPWSLGAEIAVEWGTVRDGVRRPQPGAGAAVRVDDHVYISVRNDSADTVYFSLIDVGVSGRIEVLTDDDPSGRRLAPGQEYVLGYEGFDRALSGFPLTWPDGLDLAKPRPETVLLLVSEAPQNVAPLSQRGVGRAAPPGAHSPLAGLIGRAAGGRDFKVPDRAARVVRYDVHAIDFDLEPECVFLIDERPSLPAVPFASRASAPHTVAVRLIDLIVHRNHAWGGADVRVDTMVTTGLRGKAAEPGYHTRTERFSGIRSDEALPLDNVLVYHGPARDFLDLAIWVSRDAADRPTLGELMAEEAAGFELRETLARLLPDPGALPGVAGAVSAIGLSAALVNVGYKLLRRDCTSVIGLYRGSMLAHEDFGAGRHPADGVRRVQDFSLAFAVQDLGEAAAR